MTEKVQQEPMSSEDGARALVSAMDVKIPITPDDVLTFVGSHYMSRKDAENPEDVQFLMSVHDLLSAFSWWFEIGPWLPEVPPSASVGRYMKLLDALITSWESKPGEPDTEAQQQRRVQAYQAVLDAIKPLLLRAPAAPPMYESSAQYAWLIKASRSGLPSVESAALVLKDYYEGASRDDVDDTQGRPDIDTDVFRGLLSAYVVAKGQFSEAEKVHRAALLDHIRTWGNGQSSVSQGIVGSSTQNSNIQESAQCSSQVIARAIDSAVKWSPLEISPQVLVEALATAGFKIVPSGV